MPTIRPVLQRVQADLARHGFTRRGRDFLVRTADGTGEAVVNVQTYRVVTGTAFFVNLGTGPIAYLDWLTWVNGGAVEDRSAGGIGLWRSRLMVPPDVPRTPDPRAGHHTWQFSTQDELEQLLPHLRAALDRVAPRLKELAEPGAFAGMRDDPQFWNQVQLRDPLDDLLLDAPFLPLSEVERRGVAAAEKNPLDADFTTWLMQWARRRSEVGVPARGSAAAATRATALHARRSTVADDGVPGQTDPVVLATQDPRQAVIRQAFVVAADGTRHDAAVLDLGRSLTVQLPPAAAAVFQGTSSIADLAGFIGWEAATFPPARVSNGDPGRVWIQDSRGDAVLVVRRDDRPANTAFVDLGHLSLTDTGPGIADDDWLLVTVVLSEDHLPAAHDQDLVELGATGRAWAGTVATTSGS